LLPMVRKKFHLFWLGLSSTEISGQLLMTTGESSEAEGGRAAPGKKAA